MGTVTATRYHDFCAGHTVCGHESKCAHLHGHNYRVYFTVEAEDGCSAVDSVGRVLDFSAIKSSLCEWLEENWDHRFLVWKEDLRAAYLMEIDKVGTVITPFNPTAENMAQYLAEEVGPKQLAGTGVRVVMVDIEETRKCSANYMVD